MHLVHWSHDRFAHEQSSIWVQGSRAAAGIKYNYVHADRCL